MPAPAVLAACLVLTPPVDYLTDVKPIFAARCYACHGAIQQKGGLRADTARALRDAGVVVPGDAANSPLVAHVRGADGYDRMPPPADGEALTARQVAVLRRWVDAGATAPTDERPDPDPRTHWAFRPPARPPIPPDAPHPVDAFLAAERAKHRLTARPPADRRLLLRRVTLDLTGLPPTPAEADAFLTDDSTDAFEKVVGRLLASPAYGERWGRHFLDVWRYSDWWGLGAELRNSQKHLWHWRDWVVESLNADLGYDEMVRQMLAADELYPTDPGKLRATGYLARPYFLHNRTTWLDEVVEHAGKGFLGLTVNCAKCHDHKYDPIAQTDYYRLRAVFEPYQLRTDFLPGHADATADGLPRAFDCNADAPTYKFDRGDEQRPLTNAVIAPGVPALLAAGEFRPEPVKLPAEAFAPHLRPWVRDAYEAAAAKKVAAAETTTARAVAAVAVGGAAAALAIPPTERAVGAAKAAAQAVAPRFAAEAARHGGRPPNEVTAHAREAARAEKRAELAKTEAAVAQAEWAALTAPAAKAAAAAKALEDARAAVVAALRAAVRPGEAYTPPAGSVKTLESNAEPAESRAKPFPTTSTGRRTALANWVADRKNPLTARVLVNQVWARHFGRPLVATVFDFGRKGVPPTHPELLDYLACEFMDHGWSMKHLHRLVVTSAAYRVGSSAAGPDAKADPENRYLWRQNPVRMEAQTVRDALLSLAGELDPAVGGPPVPVAEQDASRRRSLYFFQSHNDQNRFLKQFDDANVLECYRRTESIVPQQALALSNSRLALRAAERIAVRIAERSGPDDVAFAVAAFETVLGYTPSGDERAACLETMAVWRAELAAAKHPDPEAKVRTNLVGALVNHNDFVTVR